MALFPHKTRSRHASPSKGAGTLKFVAWPGVSSVGAGREKRDDQTPCDLICGSVTAKKIRKLLGLLIAKYAREPFSGSIFRSVKVTLICASEVKRRDLWIRRKQAPAKIKPPIKRRNRRDRTSFTPLGGAGDRR